MEIIDAQIHPPAPPAPLDPALPAEVRQLVGVELAREAIDSVGIDVALIVGGADYIDAAVARYPGRFGGVITFDPAAADLEAQVSCLRSRPGMVAGRALISDFKDASLKADFANGAFDRLFALAAEHQVPMFVSTHGWAEAMEPIAARHPDLTLIIDHFGVSQHPVSPPREDPWDRLPGLLKLADHPNVHVKVCGAPLLSSQPFPFTDVWPYLHQVIGAFGAERLMWASDYTRLRLAKVDSGGPRNRGQLYSNCLDFILHSGEVSEADKTQILGATARRALRWPQAQ